MREVRSVILSKNTLNMELLQFFYQVVSLPDQSTASLTFDVWTILAVCDSIIKWFLLRLYIYISVIIE